ncbi:hypothetical protein N7507_001632 [Penicillium longicatenatum]|nr:hypothetical protein N7507_001632 [Penicillium longicatenatum]
MQYKTLATLLFATAAIAAPQPEDPTVTELDSDQIPSAIESLLMTAVPSTWINEFYTNADFRMSEISAMQKGDYPEWVTSLPSSAEAYVTSEIQVELSEYTSMTAAMSTDNIFTFSGSSSGSSTPVTMTTSGTQTTSGASSTGSSSDTTSSGASSTDAASSGASSSGASSSGAATSTSTAGAAAATGNLAMSFAGAAGILGVALAL